MLNPRSKIYVLEKISDCNKYYNKNCLAVYVVEQLSITFMFISQSSYILIQIIFPFPLIGKMSIKVFFH